MATHIERAEFAEHPTLLRALTSAIVTAAVQIAAEEPTVPDHARRAALAFSVIRQPQGHLASFAWAVSTNATVVDKWVAGDRDGAVGDLDFVVATVWNAVAGE